MSRAESPSTCTGVILPQNSSLANTRGLIFWGRLRSLSRSVSRILSAVVIYLGRELPLASSSLPGGCPLREGNGSLPDPVDLPSCLALLPAGVAWPRRLPGAPVVSYTTFSPLPGLATCGGLFLWPCPRVTSPGCYPALHPMESGLSSLRQRIAPRSATT